MCSELKRDALAALLRLCCWWCPLPHRPLLLLFGVGRVQFMPSASANSNGNPPLKAPFWFTVWAQRAELSAPASTLATSGTPTSTAATEACGHLAEIEGNWQRAVSVLTRDVSALGRSCLMAQPRSVDQKNTKNQETKRAELPQQDCADICRSWKLNITSYHKCVQK